MDELAGATGLSKSAVSRKILTGQVPEEWTARHGKGRSVRAEHFARAVLALTGHAVEAPPPSPSSSGNGQAALEEDAEPMFSLNVERARREHYEAERAKLKFLAEKRELLPAKDTRRAYTGAVRQTAARILQIPGQLAADLAAETDAHRIERTMEDALRTALEELRVEVAGVELLEAEAGP